MTYGNDLGLFVGSGPKFPQSPSILTYKSSSRFAAWRSLDAQRRLELVERALADAANQNLSDGFPAVI